MVIELQPIDIFSDMGAYMFARDFMRERGYRIALDGLNHQILQFIDREQLGFDLLKLIWSPEMVEEKRIEALNKTLPYKVSLFYLLFHHFHPHIVHI